MRFVSIRVLLKTLLTINILASLLYINGHNTYSFALSSESYEISQDYQPFQDIDGYYQINNVDDIKWFANQVNKGNSYINAKLLADITLNDKQILSADIKDTDINTWIPIGSENTPFKGVFDGQHHTIKNIYFNNNQIKHVGLFGFTDNATIKNVGIIDSCINGKICVGGIVGLNKGNVINCFSASVISGEGSVGGIVGGNYGKVSSSFNTGTINGKQGIGGIVGSNWAVVENGLNVGYILGQEGVGGIVGLHGEDKKQLIENSYNMGVIQGNQLVGGIVGAHDGGTVKGSHNESEIRGSEYVGGIAGGGSADTYILNSHNRGLVNGAEKVGGIIGGNWGNIVSNYNIGVVNGERETDKVVGYNKGIVEYNYDIIPPYVKN